MFILEADFVLRIKDILMFLFLFELTLNSKEGTANERIHLLIFILLVCAHFCNLIEKMSIGLFQKKKQTEGVRGEEKPP